MSSDAQLDEQTRREIGQRLLRALKRHGVTQAQAGRIAGVTRAAVGNWTKGRNLPELSQLYRVAKEYRLSTDFILFGSLYTPEVVDLARRISDLSPQQRAILATIFGRAADDGRVDLALNSKRK